ncbi:MAG: hypothetical protein ACOZCP_13585 [Pseudomonadota bacterium]
MERETLRTRREVEVLRRFLTITAAYLGLPGNGPDPAAWLDALLRLRQGVR